MTQQELFPDQDEFWMQRAGEILLKTSDKLVAGAERVASTMAWFWTAYVAAALLLASRSTQDDDWRYATLLIAPAVLLFVAYLLATWAALPIEVSFDDRRPDLIKRAHDLAVSKRWRRLRASFLVAILAAAGVAGTVTTNALSEGRDEGVRFALVDGEKLLFAGVLAEVDEVVLEVGADDAATTQRVVLITDNQFSASIPTAGPGDYKASISYEKDSQQIEISETFIVD